MTDLFSRAKSIKYNFAMGHIYEAEALVLKYHYSHRIPANIQAVGTLHLDGGLFGDLGEAIAGCIFSIPASQWKEKVWELSRLIRNESYHPELTSLISKTVNWIKRNSDIDLLISYADWTHNHHGGIYQAASWTFSGKRDKSNDGMLIDGSFITNRNCSHIYNTRSITKLREMFPDKKIEYHSDEGKYLYYKCLNKKGIEKAKRLGLESLPYPKPNRIIND